MITDKINITDLEKSYGKMELTRSEYTEDDGLVYILLGDKYTIRFFENDEERQKTIKSIRGLKELLGGEYNVVEQGRHREFLYYVAER